MIREALTGAAAGSVGTAALNMTTYGDMALRGRGSSPMPAKTAGKLAEKAHLALRMEGEEEETADHRKEGLGALLGYVGGIGVGITYGLLRDKMPDKAAWFAGFGLGAAAMLAGNGPQVALGLTDPRKWDKEAWTMDVVPHMVYGFATAMAYEAMREER